MMRNLFFYFLIIIFTSCVKKTDGPIQYSPSPYPEIEINMNYPDYSDKIYYDLATKSVVKTSISRDWFIGFSGNLTSNKIILNYALGLSCNGFTLNDTSFSRVVSENDFGTNVLKYANHYDSFADLLTNAHIDNKVYYLNFGEYGNKLKFKVLNYTTSSIKIKYALLDGSQEKIVDIDIDNSKNYTCYSFVDHKVKDIEPDKSTWDLEFTRYATLLTEFNQTQFYNVSGVLLNPTKNIGVSKFEEKHIENIDSTKLASFIYSNKISEIGYNWKKYSGQTTDGFYSIPTRTYVVKSLGKYHAIQFIEYAKQVNGVLTKGYPIFEQKSF